MSLPCVLPMFLLTHPLHQSRTTQGVRGLKYRDEVVAVKSRKGRTPQGVRGLKFMPNKRVDLVKLGRTPQGVRGLK